MALDRKDFRGKLDVDVHVALKAICEVDGVDMGVWIEQLIIPVVEKRVQDAMLLVNALPHPGKTGNGRESRSTPRKGGG